MKIVLTLTLLVCLITSCIVGQDKDAIERAALDYIEGFYVGDTMKIKRCMHPDLSKYGYSLNEDSNTYRGHNMTFRGAIEFARDVQEDPQWAAPKDAVKKIEILDMQNKIACVKATVYWGVDYLLLTKEDNRWLISKVLWQSTD